MQNRNGSLGAAVFVQTNEAAANRVLAFRRGADGQLAEAESYSTGGRGDGRPHLTSQGSVVLTADRKHLLVTNAGSDELSVFAVADDELSLLGTVPTVGAGPKSVAEHDGLVYVLNAEAPSLAGFRLGESGLEPVADSRRDLAAGADPAQVGFAPDGSTLLVTDRGTDSILTYPVASDGRLGEPTASPSSGATPYGFAFAGHDALVVTEAFGAEKGKAAASSYRFRASAVEPLSRSVGNGRSEICWAVVTPDGRYAFTTNFADSAVSRYSVAEDGSLTLDAAVAGAAVDGRAACATRVSAGTGGSCTQSMRTPAGSSAGRSTAATSHRSARGRAFPPPARASRRADYLEIRGNRLQIGDEGGHLSLAVLVA